MEEAEDPAFGILLPSHIQVLSLSLQKCSGEELTLNSLFLVMLLTCLATKDGICFLTEKVWDRSTGDVAIDFYNRYKVLNNILIQRIVFHLFVTHTFFFFFFQKLYFS